MVLRTNRDLAVALTPPGSSSHIPCATSARYPARPGNRLRTLVDGEAIAGRLAEAVEQARHSVWLTVAFYADDMRFPDGRGSLFDVLDRAAARGIDVRLLVWRRNAEAREHGRVYSGTAADRQALARRGARFRIRWDRAAGVFCQHQKSWVIDAGQPGETAFVGGMNLTAVALERHDVYLEVTGPAASDVHHNFVERWNGATERHVADGNWGGDGSDELALPRGPAAACGPSTVQIQRMLDPRRYGEEMAERSILEQYERAIDAARRTIYIANQATPAPPVAGPLLRALERGVEVVLLVPAIPDVFVYEARLDPRQQARFEALEALGRHETFTLAGIAENHAGGRRAAYVHAKLMLVDDVWATVGSCNLHAYSLGGQTEMNAAIWDAELVRGLRGDLFGRHLGLDTAALDDLAALKLFRRIARDNRRRMQSRTDDWQGLAFALAPQEYARKTGVQPDLT